MPHEHSELDGRTDFDFLIGRWAVHHRRLKERLKGCTEWEEFESTTSVCRILDGLGNMNELPMVLPSGRVNGIAVRLYSPTAQEWSIYWAASPGNGRMDVPMVGKFKGPLGEFFSHEVFEGRHVFNRFIWTVDTPDSCRWEQAFSVDGGRTWETNWVMEFVRQR